jgi:hypothetical protein
MIFGTPTSQKCDLKVAVIDSIVFVRSGRSRTNLVKLSEITKIALLPQGVRKGGLTACRYQCGKCASCDVRTKWVEGGADLIVLKAFRARLN